MKPGDKVNTWQIVVNNDNNNNLASVPLIQTDNPAASETSSTNPIYELNQAIQDNRLSSFKKYLAACKDINERDKDGNTPLHLAVKKGNLAMVKSLLLKGANVGLVDEQGNTPLHCAVLENNLEIAQLLLKHIVTTGEIKDKDNNIISPEDIINHQDNSGKTPLHVVCSVEMFELLLNMGANPNITDKAGLSVRDIISNNHYTFDARNALEAWDQKWLSEIKIPITDFSTAGNPNVAGNSQVEVDTEVAGVEPMDISAPE